MLEWVFQSVWTWAFGPAYTPTAVVELLASRASNVLTAERNPISLYATRVSNALDAERHGLGLSAERAANVFVCDRARN
jgi:hypothetical protein